MAASGQRLNRDWRSFFIVVIPLPTLFVRTARLGWGGFWDAATSPRALAAYKLSVGASVVAATVIIR